MASSFTLGNLGIDLIEMRCPCCHNTQQFKPRNLAPNLTNCAHCKRMLVVQITVKEKSNNILLSLAITPVNIDHVKQTSD